MFLVHGEGIQPHPLRYPVEGATGVFDWPIAVDYLIPVQLLLGIDSRSWIFKEKHFWSKVRLVLLNSVLSESTLQNLKNQNQSLSQFSFDPFILKRYGYHFKWKLSTLLRSLYERCSNSASFPSWLCHKVTGGLEGAIHWEIMSFCPSINPISTYSAALGGRF